MGVACAEAFAAREIERRISGRADVITGDAGERNSQCEDASVTNPVLARARTGDEDAFRELNGRAVRFGGEGMIVGQRFHLPARRFDQTRLAESQRNAP